MSKLERDFYNRDTVTVAQELLGRYLVRMCKGVPLVGRIAETEAYVGRLDKACHAYNYRRTPRTETLFAPPGTAYIYLIYGMYHCLNFVTEPEGEPCAVLIRAIEARGGTDAMLRNRYGVEPSALPPAKHRSALNGPGKLCKALSLDRSCNGIDLTGDTLYVVTHLSDVGLPPHPGDDYPPKYHTSKRIGIDYAEEAADFLWRYYL